MIAGRTGLGRAKRQALRSCCRASTLVIFPQLALRMAKASSSGRVRQLLADRERSAPVGVVQGGQLPGPGLAIDGRRPRRPRRLFPWPRAVPVHRAGP